MSHGIDNYFLAPVAQLDRAFDLAKRLRVRLLSGAPSSNLLLNIYFYNNIDNVETVLKTNNHITLSWVKHVLSCNNIKFYILDESMSSAEGNITAIPMRILVDKENLN